MQIFRDLFKLKNHYSYVIIIQAIIHLEIMKLADNAISQVK